jgi:hypothetical protein
VQEVGFVKEEDRMDTLAGDIALHAPRQCSLQIGWQCRGPGSTAGAAGAPGRTVTADGSVSCAARACAVVGSRP